MQTFEEARVADTITRAEIAKMIVSFATNVMKKDTPSLNKEECTAFSDLNQTNPELQSFILKACQLGLMGYYSDGKTVKPMFNTNGTVTRAEIGVILSRILRGNTYAGTEQEWYQKHLQALHKRGIMNFISEPMMLELRGNTLLMLQRIMKKS
jgi:hypothetical protein